MPFTMTDRTFSTPMMQQYMEIKTQYPDCMLMFRLGDFYELFLEDATNGAEVLGITLTARPRGKDGDIPMAGVPYHSADSYIAKLVKAGYKVAICEQTSEPDGKGIVERKVVRIITPGTITDESNLEHKQQNYLMTIAAIQDTVGLTLVELTTGEILVSEFALEQSPFRIPNELARFQPAEIIHQPELDKSIQKLLANSSAKVFGLEDWPSYQKNCLSFIRKQFSQKELVGIPLVTTSPLTQSLAVTLKYLEHTQQQLVKHLQAIRVFDEVDSVVLDPSTISNLELFETLRSHGRTGSLIGVLDKTKTAMGGRLLRTWIKHPLKDKKKIDKRLSTIEFFINKLSLLTDTQQELVHVSDLERLLARLNLGLGNPKDLLRLNTTIKHILSIKDKLKDTSDPLLKEETLKINNAIIKINKDISQQLQPEVPVDPKKGNFIKAGTNQTLDALRKTISKSTNWIAKAQETERQRTGISSLKIKFNKVFGYYIEISKSNLDQVPENYTRKQTLVNAERFIIPELKHHEDIILANEAKAYELEHQLFQNLLKEVLKQTHSLQQAAQAIATIDCLASLAEVAQENKYIRPLISKKTSLVLVESRHPVVEKLLDDKQFVPNDVCLSQSQQLLIITGPNMAGKSVFMRQVAIVTLLAHIGSFVPANKAEIGLVDRIFVRSGAGDAIAQGLSTFMVEMVETAQILNLASDKSLVIMDEIGRGTTTYDGISIAWAVAEYLVTKVGAKTLFATHYHELQRLEDEYPDKIKNYHAAVEQHQGEPVFIHRVLQGKAQASYGISVAKLAGVPKQVTLQANRVLKTLENTENIVNPHMEQIEAELSEINNQIDYSEIAEKIKQIDIAQTSPLEGLTFLAEIQRQLRG